MLQHKTVRLQNYLSSKGAFLDKTSKLYIDNCNNFTTNELKTEIYKVLKYIIEYCIIL